MAPSASEERVLPGAPDAVRGEVERALERLRWEPRSAAGGTIRAVWTSPVFRFRDDIAIDLSPEGSGTRVRVGSASRVGRYDFGQNARHIRRLFREVAKGP